jgi:hypothetical protein
MMCAQPRKHRGSLRALGEGSGLDRAPNGSVIQRTSFAILVGTKGVRQGLLAGQLWFELNNLERASRGCSVRKRSRGGLISTVLCHCCRRVCREGTRDNRCTLTGLWLVSVPNSGVVKAWHSSCVHVFGNLEAASEITARVHWASGLAQSPPDQPSTNTYWDGSWIRTAVTTPFDASNSQNWAKHCLGKC